MKSARTSGILAVALTCTLGACDATRQAVGNVSSIIVITTDSLWAEVGDSVLAALEPRIFAVRNERAFEVTQISPLDRRWTDLRQFRHLLLIGTAGDGWVKPALEKADAVDTQAPAMVRTRDVWARNQWATALVVPPDHAAEAVFAKAPEVALLTDSLFRMYARERMYTSAPDTLLRDTLRAESGYGILLPNVYQSARRSSDVQLFQSSTQIQGDLVRSILVAARPGIIDPDPVNVLAWRDSIAKTVYNPPQATQHDPVQMRPLQVGGRASTEVQGVWEGADPSWPMGGPFIARIVNCPNQNRSYLLDGWLYAPGGQRGSKYEYMIQLQTILDTFECASARAARPVKRGSRYATTSGTVGVNGTRLAAAQR